MTRPECSEGLGVETRWGNDIRFVDSCFAVARQASAMPLRTRVSSPSWKQGCVNVHGVEGLNPNQIQVGQLQPNHQILW